MISSARCATKSGMGAGQRTAFKSTLLSSLAQTPGGLTADTRYAVASGPSSCAHHWGTMTPVQALT
jgi:hypothetical protein